MAKSSKETLLAKKEASGSAVSIVAQPFTKSIMSYEYNRDDNVQILNYSTFYKRRFSEPKGGSSV